MGVFISVVLLPRQATLISEYSSVVQPVQLAFQQQIQSLKTQHEEFVSSLAQQQQPQPQPQPQIQLPQMEAEVKATPPPPAPPPAPTPAPTIPPTTQPDDNKPPIQMPGSSEYDASAGVQDPAATGPRGPGPHEQIPPNKPPWFDQPHPVAPWGQQQVLSGVFWSAHAWLNKRPAGTWQVWWGQL